MTSFEPRLAHVPRNITSHGVERAGAWSMKLYSVAGKEPRVSEPLLERARKIAAITLPTPAVTSARYGVGFVVVHEAHAFNTVIVDWWEQVNELRHRVFRAAPDEPQSFRDITGAGESVCVWELRVQAFEGQAWLDHVVRRASGPDFDAYLNAVLDETY